MAKLPSVEAYRAAMRAWLTANGINPSDVPLTSVPSIAIGPDGARVVEYEAFVRDDDGRILADEKTHDAVRELRSVPLVAEPPEELALLPTSRGETPVADRTVRLHFRADGTGTVELDDHPLPGVRAVTLTAGVGKPPRLELGLITYETTVEGVAEVVIPERTREALLALGWTPPEESS